MSEVLKISEEQNLNIYQHFIDSEKGLDKLNELSYNGDRLAQQILSDYLYPIVRNHIKYSSYRLREEVVDEISQEALLKIVYSRLINYDGSAFLAKVKTIANRSIIDNYRKTNRHNQGRICYLDMVSSGEEQSFKSNVCPYIPDFQVVHTEIGPITFECLKMAFKQLNPIQKKIYRYRFYFGYTVPEISSKIEMPLGTVKSHLSRIKSKLINYID